MQTKLTNPYQSLKPITDPLMFFGPASVVLKIYSALENYDSISLVGSRHSGKTTLLRCMSQPIVQKRLGYDLSHHLFVYIDIRNWLWKSSDDFFDMVSKAIIAASRERLDLSLPLIKGGDRYMAVLERVKKRGFHTVLQLDAFDDITRNQAFDPEFFMFLRAQATAGLVSYLTASIAPLNQISHAAIRGSPFFNIFGVCRIRPLASGEARDLVMIPSRLVGLPFTEEEAEWVIKFAGHHPFFMQRLCYHLFEEKSQRRTSEVNRKRILRQAYDELLPHFEYLWEELSAGQQVVMKEEAQRKGTQERQIPELSESALFRKFVRETCQLSFFHMNKNEVVAELKRLLKHLDKPEFLGASKLRHLNLVVLRVQHGDTPSTFQTGVVVREVLNEAFEKMRGPGMRLDHDSSWRLYNVLHFTYFKKIRANQEQIAARVGVSYRHYHRMKDEAIETLGNLLLEMEAACNVEDED